VRPRAELWRRERFEIRHQHCSYTLRRRKFVLASRQNQQASGLCSPEAGGRSRASGYFGKPFQGPEKSVRRLRRCAQIIQEFEAELSG
jgi:hypothetical protein